MCTGNSRLISKTPKSERWSRLCKYKSLDTFIFTIWAVLNRFKCIESGVIIIQYLIWLLNFQEHFFDPKCGTGFIANGLFNRLRNKRSKSVSEDNRCHKPGDTLLQTSNPVVETVDIKAAIDFMKSATVNDRLNNLKLYQHIWISKKPLFKRAFFEAFPRFLDIPELVSKSWIFTHKQS